MILMQMSRKYYGFSAVRYSLQHFILGKIFKIFLSLTFLFLIARYLEKQEYAAYVAFQALIILIGTAMSFGIQQGLLRFLPELRIKGRSMFMYKFMLIGVLLRVVTLCLILLLLVPFLKPLASIFNLDEWLWLLPWYLGVGILHLSTLTVSQVLESLLWQKEAQYSIAISSLIRVIAVVFVIYSTELDLVMLLAIDASAEILAMLLLGYGWYQRWQEDNLEKTKSEWWHDNRGRVFRFGWWSFLLSQANLLYGSATNRLVAAHYLPAVELAILGVADNLTNLVRRFMPARLLVSLIRPIFVAHYAEDANFNKLTRMSNFIYRLNMIILVLPIALLLIVGKPVFEWLTAGKYAAAAPLFAGFLVLMFSEGLRILLETMAQAVEKSHVMVASNLVQSASLLVAIPLIQYMGIWALPVANLGGTITANIITILLLRRYGYRFSVDAGLISLTLIYGILTGVAGWGVIQESGSYFMATLIMVLIYGILCIVKPPFHKSELNMLANLFRKRMQRGQETGEIT